MIERGRDQKGDRHIKADVVIVGTGAGGGMAASELAGRGLSVVALEEGPYLEQKDMTQREVDMMGKLYQERGGRATADMAIRVLGGRCVGGSTVHNINLCKRTPKAILDTWAREHHVSGCSEKEMRPVFESVERELSVSEIPAGWRNANNQVLERGVKALGWKGGPLRHNRVGCQQSGFCELGCPFNAKQNSLKVLVPDALDHGAQVISDVRVSRIVHDGHRASGVIGAALGADGSVRGRLVVDADVVVLAGSAIGSAMLGVQSGLPDPYDRLGRNLHMHPGIAVAGLFDDHIDGWKGIPQSYECMQLMDYNMNSDRRVWITTVFAHPIGAAVMLPGFGMEHREWMRRYRNIAVLTAMVHDETFRARRRARRRSRADRVQARGLGRAPVLDGHPRLRPASLRRRREEGAGAVRAADRARSRQADRPDPDVGGASVQHPDGGRAPHGQHVARRRSEEKRRQEHGRAPPGRAPVRAGRLAVPDQPRSPAADLDLQLLASPVETRGRAAVALIARRLWRNAAARTAPSSRRGGAPRR